jgi:predicted PurR-regulated permease PerM
MTILAEAKSASAGLAAAAPDSGEAGGPEAAHAVHSPIAIAPETIRHAGNALFVLWLKIAATLLAARLMSNIWQIVVLAIFTLMLVATLNPLVRRLQKRLTRAKAIAIVVFGIVATTGALLVLMIPPLVSQAKALVVNLPHYLSLIENATHRMGVKLNLHGSSLDLSQHAASLGEAFDALVTVFTGIAAVLTVAVLTTYLLIDGQSAATSALGMLPRHQRLPIRQMFGEIGSQVGDYMRGQLITSVQAGVFSYILLLVLGVPEPLPLAVLMAVADVIPMIGPLVGTVPAVLMALTLGPAKAVIVLVGYVVYHQIESHIIVPRVYGRAMKLSPTVIIFSLLVGAMLMGISGALLALPAAAAAPVVFRHVQEWRQREDEHNNKDAVS